MKTFHSQGLKAKNKRTWVVPINETSNDACLTASKNPKHKLLLTTTECDLYSTVLIMTIMQQ